MGTRLGPLAHDCPKPLLPVAGRPVLDHILDSLAGAGLRRFLLVAGHMGNVIANHYRDSGGRPGCTVTVEIEQELRGTAGAVRAVAEQLDDNFLLAYGDVFLDFDVRRLIAAYETSRPLGTLLVRASDHPWDSHLVVADETGRVRRIRPSPARAGPPLSQRRQRGRPRIFAPATGLIPVRRVRRILAPTSSRPR